MKKRYLVLSDGTVYEGLAFGADGDAIGELVFTTGMCGYIETLTDPGYYGQIVLQTFPLIGNYGIIPSDFEGKCSASGYVVRDWCDTPSNFRCEYDLDKYLKEQGVPGIYGLDTREITRTIRENGVMNACITDALPDNCGAIQGFEIKDAVEAVTVKEAVTYKSPLRIADIAMHNVVLVDYGTQKSIVTGLLNRACNVTVVPASYSAEQIMQYNPDGIVLSNGPGNPESCTYQIEQIKKLLGRVPVFGIGLGHELTAIAAGGSTFKLKYGHRGGNQPVKEVNGTRTFITNQNHGYAVVTDGMKAGKVSFINVNDGTCEGIDYPGYNAFTVQFYPDIESSSVSTSFLLDRFVNAMGGDR